MATKRNRGGRASDPAGRIDDAAQRTEKYAASPNDTACSMAFASAGNARQLLGNLEVDLINTGRQQEYEPLEARLIESEHRVRERCFLPQAARAGGGFFSRIFG